MNGSAIAFMVAAVCAAILAADNHFDDEPDSNEIRDGFALIALGCLGLMLWELLGQ